nr:unnamed protein product [Spirometra erinaceieuropaei]
MVFKAFLGRWIATFGVPSTITTDLDAQFEYNIFQSLLSFIGCTRIHTTACSLAANRMVERVQRQLKAFLRAADNPENWTDHLPLVLLGIRSSVKSDLDCSAADLVLGATLRFPGQMTSPTPRVAVKDPTNILYRFRQFMRTLSPVAPRPSVSESYLAKDLATCSHVYLRYDRVRRPLEPPYDGSFRVISRGTKNFCIQSGTREEVVCVDRRKAAMPNTPPDEPYGPLSPAPPPRPSLYRLLEAVAKSRYNGVPISGADGLLGIGESSSTIFYFRKILRSKRIVISQPYIARDPVKQTLRRTTLLHCFRYFRALPYPLALLLEKISNELADTSTKMMLPHTIRSKFNIGRRSYLRLVKFGEQEGCLKVLSVPFNTACGLLCGTEEESEVTADLLQKDETAFAAASDGVDHANPSLIDNHGRRYVREAAIVCLQRPFDMQTWMQHSNETAKLDYESGDEEDFACSTYDGETVDGDRSQADVRDESIANFVNGPFYTPNIDTEASLVVQFCRHLSTSSTPMPNSDIISFFNVSHKMAPRYAQALSSLGKLLASKLSVGPAFTLAYRYITETEAIEYLQSIRNHTSSSGASNFLNQRRIRRDFILKNLEEVKVYPSLCHLRQVILAEEEKKGLTTTMDRKSLLRIIEELLKERLVKFITMKVTNDNELKMLCHPSIDTDSPELINCVLLEKQRIYARHTKTYDAASTPSVDVNWQNEPALDLRPISAVQAITRKELELIRLPDKNVSRLRRRYLLHHYLYYVVYVLPNDAQPLSNTPSPWAPVYNMKSPQYRFVSPHPPVPDFPPGWVSVNEVVKRMPLGLYLAIANPASAPRLLLEWLNVLPGDNMRAAWRTLINEQAQAANLHSEFAGTKAEEDADYDGTEVLRKLELLRCPISKVPILGGPRGGLNSWLLSRYNVCRLYSVVEQLSGHGLLTLHGQSAQGALPMANVFVHKKASILDTRFAAPTRHIIVDTSQCSSLHYHFDSLAAVENYWLNFRAVLLYTPIGFTRFWDPSLINFTDSKPPVLQVERPEQVVDDGQLPQLPLVSLKNSCQTTWRHEEYSTEPRVLLGVGGLHCVLYASKSPFEEAGYGANEQGAAVQNIPVYPSPSALRPVLSTHELAFLYGAFEPGVITTGDGAFWPWTVKLFYKRVPISPLPPPPMLPAWLFRNRNRRFPFRIAEECVAEGQQDATLTGPVKPQRVDIRGRRRQVKTAVASGDEAAGSLSSASTQQEENGYSSFDDLYSAVQTRKRRLRKNPTITHINRKLPRRDYRLGDRRALDSRDVEIRQNLLCRRASWSKLEDQFLLTCRVASVFLVGHTREYVCVPYVLVRDQLHYYLPIVDSTDVINALSSCPQAATSDADAKVQPPNAKHSRFTRDWLFNSRDDLKNKYEFVLLASVSNEYVLPDIGNSRSAIVAEALRNFLLSAVRIGMETSRPRDPAVFSRTLRQYPFEQLSQAIKALAQTDSMRRVKLFEECDLNVVGQFKLKFTLRLSTWCNLQFFVFARFFIEAVSLRKQYVDAIGSAHIAPDKPFCITRHNFSDGSSGGLVALFLEFMLHPETIDVFVSFDTSCISLLSRPCLSLEDRRAVMNEEKAKELKLNLEDDNYGSADDDIAYRKQQQGGTQTKTYLAPNGDQAVEPGLGGDNETVTEPQAACCEVRPFGDFTHSGMTMALLDSNVGESDMGTSSISDALLAIIGTDFGATAKGKSPRIDVRLSVNGGYIEARYKPDTARTLAIPVVCCDSTYKDVCMAVFAKFLEPLIWRSGQCVAAPTATASNKARLLAFISSGADLGRKTSEIATEFGDTAETCSLLQTLVDESLVFMLGLTEPRYVHRANLRLWLVHVKDPEARQQVKRRRLTPSPAPLLVPCSITLTREDPSVLASKAHLRILCFLLQDLQLIRIFRVSAVSSNSLFSKPSAVEYSTDRNLLGPANELTVRLESSFVSRMITACECFSEYVGVIPDSPQPYVSLTKSRNPRRSTVLKRKAENTGAPDLHL